MARFEVTNGPPNLKEQKSVSGNAPTSDKEVMTGQGNRTLSSNHTEVKSGHDDRDSNRECSKMAKGSIDPIALRLVPTGIVGTCF